VLLPPNIVRIIKSISITLAENGVRMVKLGFVPHYLKGRPTDKCRDNKM
jgi:hypothetical protein